jgi:hypothetical protein
MDNCGGPGQPRCADAVAHSWIILKVGTLEDSRVTRCSWGAPQARSLSQLASLFLDRVGHVVGELQKA